MLPRLQITLFPSLRTTTLGPLTDERRVRTGGSKFDGNHPEKWLSFGWNSTGRSQFGDR